MLCSRQAVPSQQSPPAPAGNSHRLIPPDHVSLSCLFTALGDEAPRMHPTHGLRLALDLTEQTVDAGTLMSNATTVRGSGGLTSSLA
jgi:hypothetical protein